MLPVKIAKASDRIGEDKDCAVKAVAIACGAAYAESHSVFKQLGRKNGRGTGFKQIEEAISIFGRFTQDVTSRFKAKTVATLERELPQRGIFLVYTRGHILACRGGKVLDWTEGRRFKILKVLRVKTAK